MRRWNGWGDDGASYPVSPNLARFLASRVGPGRPCPDAAFSDMLAAVPLSRLPAHPGIVTEPADRLRHARGQSLPDWIALRSGRITGFPDGVAYPESDTQVRELLDFATRVGACIIPYGGGTSVVGGINVMAGESPVLTLDLRRLSDLLRLDDASGLATFGAGVPGPALEARLRARGYALGHYPQSFEYSTLGGWIVTRSTGQQSMGYGRIERLFAGGKLQTPAGTVELPVCPASAAGPDLRELVLGSEGRLGVLTEATVRIAPLPELQAFQTVFFPDWDAAFAAARAIAQARVPLSLLRQSTAVETETTLAMAGHDRAVAVLERLLAARGARSGKCMLLLGVSGRRAVARTARSEALGLAARHGGVHVGQILGKEWRRSRFRTPYLRNSLWDMGYAIDMNPGKLLEDHR